MIRWANESAGRGHRGPKQFSSSFAPFSEGHPICRNPSLKQRFWDVLGEASLSRERVLPPHSGKAIVGIAMINEISDAVI